MDPTQALGAYVTQLFQHLSSPWRNTLGLAFLVVLIAPKLNDLYREYLDVRMGKRHLELQKLNLEVLKLRGELGDLGLLEDLPKPKEVAQDVLTAYQPEAPNPQLSPESLELEEGDHGIPISHQAEAPQLQPPSPKPSAPKRTGWFSVWCTRHPRIARPILLLIQSIMILLAVEFALSAIVTPGIILTSNKNAASFGSFVTLFITAVIFLGIAVVFYKLFIKFNSLRRELRDR